MNWGKSIIVVFVLFVLMMMYFMVQAIRSGSEKVPDKYYEKGNKYQEVLDEEIGAKKFKTNIEYYSAKGCFAVSFDSLAPDSGKAFFQWPPDEKLNIQKKFILGFKGEHKLFNCAGPKGGWNAEIEFWSNGKKYIHKQKVWVE